MVYKGKKLSLLIVAMTSFVITSCSNTSPNSERPLSEKNPLFHGTLEKSSDKRRGPRSYDITMSREALKQRFLMSVAKIDGAPTPTGNAFANKIIYFTVKNDSVYLFESLDGKLNSASIKTKTLLAEFPIVFQNAKSITFDFKSGMKSIFVKRSYYLSDISVANDHSDEDGVLDIILNYIDKVETRGNYLYINQFVRYDLKSAQGETRSKLAELKYTFSTYKENKSFHPRSSNLQEKVGYFEVHPVLEAPSGKKSINIMKFPMTRPITYSLSKNIPREYRQAVRDGAHYWNKVFGKSVIQLEELPDDISVHEPGYNFIQWIDWDNAGFAYANMQADPLTGEIFQGHVYMTSSFGISSLKKAKKHYKRLLTESNTEKSQTKIGLKGFHDANNCKFDHNKALKVGLGDVIDFLENQKDLSNSEKEKIFQRFTNDYIRLVVAHEIGHTLGLRHNFAGSLNTTITPETYDTVSKVYFLTGELLPGMIPASTVMDYFTGMMGAMMGAHIRLQRDGFNYDKQAISYGYTKDDVKVENFDTFCTDSHRFKGVYADCRTWDSFANPIVAAYEEFKLDIRELAFTLALKFDFLADKNIDPERVLKLNQLQLTPGLDTAKLFRGGFHSLTHIFSPKAEFINIRREFPKSMNVIEKENYLDKVLDFKRSEANKLGGIATPLLSHFQQGHESVKNIAISAQIKEQFKINMEKLYPNISEQERKLIKEKTDIYFETLEKEILFGLANALEEKTFAVKDKNFSEKLASLSHFVLFEKGDEILGQASINGPLIFRPRFDYRKEDKNLRNSFRALLKQNFFPSSPSYMRDMKSKEKEIVEAHETEIKNYLKDTDINDVPDDVYDWIYFEKELFCLTMSCNEI